jgi:hypothetical protein
VESYASKKRHDAHDRGVGPLDENERDDEPAL